MHGRLNSQPRGNKHKKKIQGIFNHMLNTDDSRCNFDRNLKKIKTARSISQTKLTGYGLVRGEMGDPFNVFKRFK